MPMEDEYGSLWRLNASGYVLEAIKLTNFSLSTLTECIWFFYISYQSDLIELMRVTTKKGIDGCVIKSATDLRTDAVMNVDEY